ncbi:MAG: hypothetical protein N3E41_02345 [Thermofilaceae archaeon]|nr:hypothetical protein [Thermofilaceae archaeon]MDW8003599.1 hypothetical protein [Thermofilaceae archaeon]
MQWLRKGGPRRIDNFVVGGRGDLPSRVLVALLEEVERNYDVTISVVEINAEPTLNNFCYEKGLKYTFVKAYPTTYTEYRLMLTQTLNQVGDDPLVVMPDTSEDLIAYTIGEVLQGNLKGLSIDISSRVAYPFAAVSLKTIAVLFPHNIGNISFLYTVSPVRELAEDLLLSIPTFSFSVIKTLFAIIQAIKQEKDIKTCALLGSCAAVYGGSPR